MKINGVILKGKLITVSFCTENLSPMRLPQSLPPSLPHLETSSHQSKRRNRLIYSCANVPVNLKLQHHPPSSPRRAFELLKIDLFKFPPLGAKSRSNAPPISTEIPLLKDKFHLQSNTFQRGRKGDSRET